jgi:probable rRNA maturation factor
LLSICGSTFEITEKVLRHVAKEAFLYIGRDFEVNLRFVSEKKIRELNRIYRNRDMVTDVLSFGLNDKEPGGDVAICYKEVKRQSTNWKHTVNEAASLLLVHGMLHLSGFEHTKTLDRAKMESAEQKILSKAGVRIER